VSDDAILSRWAATLARSAARPAIIDSHANVLATFADVETRSRKFERESPLRTFPSGEVVAIQIGNHADWPALLLACLRLRLVALPLERMMSDYDRDAAMRICRAAVLITAAESAALIQTLEECSRIDWGERQPSLLKLTSGTTAAPRAIGFQSEQLLADCDQICETMGITDADLNFAVIPVSHSYGFSNLITPLICRGVSMVVSRDRMPRAVLDDLARTGATVFPGMPVFFQAFGDLNDVPQLPKLRLCISAGAPLRTAVAKKFREKFGLAVHSFYGSSECGGICYDREATADIDGFVGQQMDGVEIEMLDTAAASRIRVRSVAAADGYFPASDEEKLSVGFFVPDDLLTASDGGFRIVGRVSDLINVAGKKVNPAEVEAHLLLFDGVREAVVFGLDSSLRNQEVAACVVAGTEVNESSLLEFCRRRLSGWQVPKRIFFVDAMPANERGKISRRDLASRFGVRA
jgi:acyl-CoA synthetase (AMP-forming)/AMP-acid ligase II